MTRFFSAELLRRLRNEIAVARLLEQLEWPRKQRDGRLCFLCPKCGEFLATINPHTNLGRCFRCEINFNPIDLVIRTRHCDFVTAVQFLQSQLPPLPSR